MWGHIGQSVYFFLIIYICLNHFVYFQHFNVTNMYFFFFHNSWYLYSQPRGSSGSCSFRASRGQSYACYSSTLAAVVLLYWGFPVHLYSVFDASWKWRLINALINKSPYAALFQTSFNIYLDTPACWPPAFVIWNGWESIFCKSITLSSCTVKAPINFLQLLLWNCKISMATRIFILPNVHSVSL